MPSCKRNILYIRCSDGRSRRPENIRNHCVHQIRLPGGILFPELCAKNEAQLMRPLVEMVVMFAITTMIRLKKPDEVILASHDDCGAATDIGLDTTKVKRKHASLGTKLRKKFPNTTITVLHEKHCESGENHYGHEHIELEEAA
jgi:hypothetical protein